MASPSFSASSLVPSPFRIYYPATCPFVPDLALRPLSPPPPRLLLLLRRAPPPPRESSRRRAAANSGGPLPPGDDSDDLSDTLSGNIEAASSRTPEWGPSGDLAVPCRPVILKEHVLVIIGKCWLAFRWIPPPAYRIPPSQVLFGWLRKIKRSRSQGILADGTIHASLFSSLL